MLGQRVRRTLFGTAALEALADDWQLLFRRVLPVLLLQLALFQLAGVFDEHHPPVFPPHHQVDLRVALRAALDAHVGA